MSEDEVFEDTPAARSALLLAFNTLKERKNADAWEDAVEWAMDALRIQESDELTPSQKFLILCSALSALLSFLDSVDDVHPYSQSAIDLRESISLISFIALNEAGVAVGMEEFSLKLPAWLDT